MNPRRLTQGEARESLIRSAFARKSYPPIDFLLYCWNFQLNTELKCEV